MPILLDTDTETAKVFLVGLRIAHNSIKLIKITGRLRTYIRLVAGAYTFGKAVNYRLSLANRSPKRPQLYFQTTVPGPFLLQGRLLALLRPLG